MFKRGIGREFIEFDEFAYGLSKNDFCYWIGSVCRQTQEDLDKFIFELFNLGQKREGNIIP